jgi:hypothetical protein
MSLLQKSELSIDSSRKLEYTTVYVIKYIYAIRAYGVGRG